MANTTTGQQQNKHEDSRNVKTTVFAVARNLQQTLTEVKLRAAALSDAIKLRREEFRQVEEAALQEAMQATQSEVAQAEIIETPEVSEVEAPTVSEQTAPVETEAQPEQPTPVEEQKVQEPEPEPEKPKIKVVTTIENGIETKTYTDEKGNVKVRKFLDMSATKRPSTPSTTARRDTRTQGSGVDKTRSGASKDGQSKRPLATQQGQKKYTPVVDLPRNEPQKSHGNKNKTKDHPDEKRPSGLKRSILTRDYSADYDDERVVRRNRTKKADSSNVVVAPKITHAVVTTEEVPLKSWTSLPISTSA